MARWACHKGAVVRFSRGLLIGLWVIGIAYGGPWVHDPGDGYLKVGYAHFRSAESFNGGESVGLAFRSDIVDLYGEFGLPWDLQLIASLPYVMAVNSGSGGSRYIHRWTGDLRIELDRQLLDTPVLATGVEVRLPTYRDPSEYARARGLDAALVSGIAQNFPMLGDTNVDITAKMMVGTGLSKPNGWISAELGPRIRLGPYASGAFGAVNLGLWLYEQKVGVNAYTNLNLNLFAPPDDLSRQVWYAQTSLFVTGFKPAPAAALNLWVGGVPWASGASRGIEFGTALSTRY